MTAIAWLFPLGFQELLLILVIVLVIFGATKLPQLGKGLGEGIRNLKKGLQDEGEAAEPDHRTPPKDA
jgi:sec-independent protein translocase protein TatA